MFAYVRKFPRRVIVVIVCLVLVISSGVWVWRSNSDTAQQVRENIESKTLETPRKVEVPFEVASWSPDWASSSAVESIQTNKNKLTNFSPVWYEVKDDGSLNDKTPAQKTNILDAANQAHLEITPTVGMFDFEIFAKIVASPENFDRHVKALIDLGTKDDVDGLDLDYESTQLSDKDKYFEFLDKVSAGLKAKNKKLVVTVLPQWNTPVPYKSLKETRQVQDWSKIAQYADEVRIMAYDYTGSGAAFPGPIGPLSWQELVIQYALTKIPKEKIVLGVQLYSYEKWVDVSDTVPVGDFSAPSLQVQIDWTKNEGVTTETRSYSYETIKNVRAKYPGQLSDLDGEKVYKYSKTNEDTGKMENRVLIYIDDVGVKQRIDLAHQYGIKGVSFWRMGAEADILNKLPDV